ncbi:MAG: hypothetical protein EPO32_03835 [Anaerolineae bacterium]|nr:MAG: hypothetical protein EPO32_03835 [Anaerolineae bacterium]
MNPIIPKSQPDKPAESVLEWLLDSDPSIRWQVMRDLTNEPAEAVAAMRSRVATEGWGAELLKRQNTDGSWGDGASTPVWSSTLHTLQLLWNMGLDPLSEPARRAVDLVRAKVTWGPGFGDASFFEGETEPCINGRVIGLAGYFGEASDRLLERLLREQLKDGGWNCEAENGSVRSSFHTTICVLEGLLEYEKSRSATEEVTAARLQAQEYLLERRLFRSLSNGEVVALDKKTGQPTAWMSFSFPTTWHYDVLRGLDTLRNAGVRPDERVAEAVELVTKKRDADGRWPRENIHADPVGLAMEGAAGTPSRWNTLRAQRVLDWYSSGSQH